MEGTSKLNHDSVTTISMTMGCYTRKYSVQKVNRPTLGISSILLLSVVFSHKFIQQFFKALQHTHAYCMSAKLAPLVHSNLRTKSLSSNYLT